MDLPGTRLGVVDSEDFVERVALYTRMFLMGLRLSFCCPIRDVLDFLGLGHSQLFPNAWKILLSCFVFWRQVWSSLVRNIPTSLPESSFIATMLDVTMGTSVAFVLGLDIEWHVWTLATAMPKIHIRSFSSFLVWIGSFW
ncbi:hypothetical protein F2P56_014327 [Juglans regia]|uniref:Uncharacterized protein n=1 Tax=Juglans regia TaxID=51240 RepID=A0A833XDG5_JUGRE|nr:hypothetical protein F2P56_014327 [Juglans regia]